MILEEIIKLGVGSVIELNSGIDQPVELVVNNRILARGEVVTVDGFYGIRITEITSAGERFKSLNSRNPILVYLFLLAMYGLLTVLILTYVHAEFRVAAKTLKMLQTEWTSAESKHASMVDVAQEQLSKLSTPAPPVMAAPAQMRLMRHPAVGFDLHGIRL